MPVRKTAVVGGGIAGLACANELTEGGPEVGLFERDRELAGRMRTRPGGGAPNPSGTARVCHGRDVQVKVLIADPQPLALAGMRASLAKIEGLLIVAESRDANQLLEQADQHRPDLLIADLSLKGPRPEKWLRCARDLSPALKVLICTANREQSVVEHVTGCGVEGYILKTESIASFAQAVRSISQGASWFSQEILYKMHAARTDRQRALTARETDVLELVRGGLSNRQIADCLSLAEQTVCNHVRNLYDKLHTNNRVELVLWAREHLLAVS